MTPETATHDFGSILILGAISLIILVIAHRFNFFQFSKEPYTPVPVRLVHMVVALALFILVPVTLATTLMKLISNLSLGLSSIFIISLSQCIAYLIAPTLMLGYLAYLGKPVFRGFFPKEKGFLHPLLFGIVSYVVSFPVVMFLDSLLEYISYLIFKVPSIDQVAVTFLKKAREEPLSLIMALYTIIIAAPIFEELTFRGFLQTYLRNKLGPKAAILLSSLIFALFHYSGNQSHSNLPLLISLFAFALFLGFVFEKSRSLLSSITLHLTFNAVTVIRFLLS